MASPFDNDLITKYESDFGLTYNEILQKIESIENETSSGRIQRVFAKTR